MTKITALFGAVSCAVLLTCAGCLTGADDPDDAVGDPLPEGDGVREEFKYDWENETSPTDTEPAFPQDDVTAVE